MFDQTFVETRADTRKPVTVGISLAMQAGLVAVVLIAPLIHPGILHPKLDVPVIFTLRQVKEPPAAVERRAIRRTAPRAFTGPTRVPERIAKVVDIAASTEAENFAPVGGLPGLGTGAIGGGFGIADLPAMPAPQPKPAPKTQPASNGPVTVSTGVQAAKLISGPKPLYPPLARASRTQGTVRLEAIIARDGSIRELRVTAGSPLLAKAGLDAVQQWRYQPTLLNGVPVEVITEIDVVFTLN